MSDLIRDVRHGLRSLLRSPGFTVAAVLTIGLGIGANTAIFSVVRAVLLRPLPYEDPDRLVLVWGEMRQRNVTDFPFSPPASIPPAHHTTAPGRPFADPCNGTKYSTGYYNHPAMALRALRCANLSVCKFPMPGTRRSEGQERVRNCRIRWTEKSRSAHP